MCLGRSEGRSDGGLPGGGDIWTCLRMSRVNHGCPRWHYTLWPHGLYSPWNSPDQNTGVGSLSLLQGFFPTQESNPGFPHCGLILYQLSHKGSPLVKKPPANAGDIENGSFMGRRLGNCQASVYSSVLSCHNKDLEWRTLKPLARHSSRVLDRPCYSSQVSNGPCYSS